MPTNFPPPVNVSPLIRFGRYSFLFAGLAYGAFWQSRYTKKELGLKDIKAKEKAARDARLAQEKAIKSADNNFVIVPKSINEESNKEINAYKDEIRKPCPKNFESHQKLDDTIIIGAETDFDGTRISNNNVKVTETSFYDWKEIPSDTVIDEKSNNLKSDRSEGDSLKIEEDINTQVNKDIKIKVDEVKNIPSEETIVIKRNIDNANDLQIVKDFRESILEESAGDSVKEKNILDRSISSIESVMKEIQNSVFPNSQLPSQKKSRFLALIDRKDNVPEEANVWHDENVDSESTSELLKEDENVSFPDSKLFFDSYVSQHSFTLNINSLFLYLYDKLFEPAKVNENNFENINDEIPDHFNFEDILFSHGPS